MMPKEKKNKQKIDKLDIVKAMKLLCFKGHHQESEKTTHRMGKILANNIPIKGLVSRIHKEL